MPSPRSRRTIRHSRINIWHPFFHLYQHHRSGRSTIPPPSHTQTALQTLLPQQKGPRFRNDLLVSQRLGHHYRLSANLMIDKGLTKFCSLGESTFDQLILISSPEPTQHPCKEKSGYDPDRTHRRSSRSTAQKIDRIRPTAAQQWEEIDETETVPTRPEGHAPTD